MGEGRTIRAGSRPDPADGLFGTDRPGELHERIYRSLIHAIASGRFAAGSRLPSEPELAAAFSVSRPVVRQAIDKLKADGLVSSQRGSGTYVTSLDHLAQTRLANREGLREQLDQMQSDLEFRLVYEPEAARLAAERHSEADLARMEEAMAQFRQAHEEGRITHHYDYLFHEAIARATGNSRFVRAAQSLEYAQDDAWLVIRHLVYFQPPTRAVEILAEHAAVLAFIRARDGNAARQAMADHIRASRQRLAGFFAPPDRQD
ncbi:FadR/GntR family transcriptional regulator [Ruixingdingia sedimenti]|uniref:FadR/GntR family transcriptional regulator n=1 Tax=Ruixingdingia sedimenti TaxID=3073604 RepID=A0ABU1F3M6_9RHOB|nr:FadR/GntR family transcriptional regulator [Xinfangfangia sp. LG-4]MDR5651462.1 FadR/GntR family transcriptional regulator [Xinfangfangia sp. LG-4]